jgi:hypothetical protein
MSVSAQPSPAGGVRDPTLAENVRREPGPDPIPFIGFHTTFPVQHWLGAEGMPRRIGDYAASDGFTTLNMVSARPSSARRCCPSVWTVWNVWKSYRYGAAVSVDDPWGAWHAPRMGRLLPAAAA